MGYLDACLVSTCTCDNSQPSGMISLLPGRSSGGRDFCGERLPHLVKMSKKSGEPGCWPFGGEATRGKLSVMTGAAIAVATSKGSSPAIYKKKR